MQTMARPATTKQYELIKRLLHERDYSEVAERVYNDRAWATAGRFTTADASALIDILLKQPKRFQEKTEKPEPEAGIYAAGNDYIRVYRGQKSGAMLAKLVVLSPTDSLENPVDVDYEYLGSARRVLPDTAERLTLDQVGVLGGVTGQCMMCGRRLDDPESVDRGIGPVCAANY